MPSVSLVDAAADVEAIRVLLSEQLATYNVTVDALTITAGGASEAVRNNAVPTVQVTIDMPGGWRGMGHLTGSPVNYLCAMALDRLGIPAQ